MEGRDFIERTAWVLLIASAFSYAGYLIFGILKDFKENPLTTTFYKIPIYSVPYPAMTIGGGTVWNPEGFVGKAFQDVVREKDGEPMKTLQPLLQKALTK